MTVVSKPDPPPKPPRDPWPPARPYPVPPPPTLPKPQKATRRRLAVRAALPLFLLEAVACLALAFAVFGAITAGNMQFPMQPVAHPPGPALTFLGAHDPFPVLSHGRAIAG